MKSVKSKLFISYCITIFIVLFLISFSSLVFFSIHQETKTLSPIESTYSSVENILLNSDNPNLRSIEKKNNIFIIVSKNKKVFYSDLSISNNKKITLGIDYKTKHYDIADHEYDGYIEVDDYIIKYQTLKKDNNEYKIYVGIYEHILDEFLEDIYLLALVVNMVLFIILVFLGYFLINKTINPLKLILNDLGKLQNKKDLSLRLKQQNTNDEFEKITEILNNMLEWIEQSVENIKQFSSDASHELRTPITIIQGEIELYKRKDNSNIELSNTLSIIDSEQKKLQNIINDFLLLSKIDKEVLDAKEISLDKVIFDVIESNLLDLEKKDLELKMDIDENLKIRFHEKYLFIVLNNLFSNAIKYTQEGFIKIEAREKDNRVYFLIEDSGLGIDNKNISKIFERFYRVDESRTNSQKGIGLGLSIVKKICERFNYNIKVESEINKGTIFIIH